VRPTGGSFAVGSTNGRSNVTTWELIAVRTKDLPADKQQEVLDFVEFLKQRMQPKRSLFSIRGDWADLGFDVTTEDIADVRQEMWGNFPREIR
jgi:hypothetical protein